MNRQIVLTNFNYKRAIRTLKLNRVYLSPSVLNLIFIVYLVGAFNRSFFAKIDELHTSPGWIHDLFMVSAAILLSIVINFFLTFFTYKYIHKITLMVIIIGSSITSFYMDTFGIKLI